MKVKHPEVVVELSSIDSNAFGIMGATMKGLRRAGVSPEEVEEYHVEATSGDYDHLIQTTMRWVTVR